MSHSLKKLVIKIFILILLFTHVHSFSTRDFVYYSLDETEGNYLDNKGFNPLLVVGDAQHIQRGVKGKVGKAISINDPSTYFTFNTTNLEARYASFSLSFWVKLPSNQPNQWHGLIALDNRSPNNARFVLYTQKTDGYSRGSGIQNFHTAHASLNDNEWHHIVILLDSPNARFSYFLDGKRKIDTYNIGKTNFISEIRFPDGGIGTYDEIRLYNYVISDEMVRGLYEGSPNVSFSSVSYHSEVIHIEFDKNLDTSVFSTPSPSDFQVRFYTTIGLQEIKNVSVIENRVELTVDPMTLGQTISVSYLPGDKTLKGASDFLEVVTFTNYKVDVTAKSRPPAFYFKFDERSGRVANNSLPFGNPLTNYGGVFVNQKGKYGEQRKERGFRLNGVDGYIEGQLDGLVDVSELTLSFFIEIDTNLSSRLDGTELINIDDKVKISLLGGSLKYHVDHTDTVEANVNLNFDDFQYDELTWDHITITMSASNNRLRIYRNGFLLGTINDWNKKGSASWLRIGRKSAPFLKATVDDLRIYGYELTPKQVLPEASTGVRISPSHGPNKTGSLISHYKLDETTPDEPLVNSGPLGTMSVTKPETWSVREPGILGTSRYTTGGGLNLDLPYDVLNMSNFTISFWIKTNSDYDGDIFKGTCLRLGLVDDDFFTIEFSNQIRWSRSFDDDYGGDNDNKFKLYIKQGWNNIVFRAIDNYFVVYNNGRSRHFFPWYRTNIITNILLVENTTIFIDDIRVYDYGLPEEIIEGLSIPLELINITPSVNAKNVPLDQKLIFNFSKTIVRSTLEDAFNLRNVFSDKTVTGTWLDGPITLTGIASYIFVPSQLFPPDTEFEIRMQGIVSNTDQKTINFGDLDQTWYFSFGNHFFRTEKSDQIVLDNFQVETITPSDDHTLEKTNGQVSVKFSQAVELSTVKDKVSILDNKAKEVLGSWSKESVSQGKLFHYTPSSPFNNNEDYTVKIDKSLVSSNGVLLTKDITSKFIVFQNIEKSSWIQGENKRFEPTSSKQLILEVPAEIAFKNRFRDIILEVYDIKGAFHFKKLFGNDFSISIDKDSSEAASLGTEAYVFVAKTKEETLHKEIVHLYW